MINRSLNKDSYSKYLLLLATYFETVHYELRESCNRSLIAEDMVCNR